MKKTTAFFCQECGYESAKWVGQCPACRNWNTMVEEPVRTVKPQTGFASRAFPGSPADHRPVSLKEIGGGQEVRIPTGFPEMDRVLGGGVVKGSMILIGGDPGIGKSTLLLQAAANMARDGRSVLYVSGEESLQQIRLRAERVGGAADSLRFYCETDLDDVRETVLREKPELVIIDSIQTMFSAIVDAAPGAVSQVRETTGVLLRLAKETGTTFFIIGHVTKEGTVAGPRVLEHMVDTVLYFEGDRYSSYRILRGVKNRFGATNEIGVFEMRGEGLAEVPDPSEYLLSGRPTGTSGSVVTCSMEGTRPMLTEVQALVTRSSFGFPKRQAAGTDLNRMSVLLAVMEKRLGIPLSEYDAYVNLAGGMRQKEPSLDLGIVLAVLSSYTGRAIDSGIVAFGEVGLAGEVRQVSQAEQRVQEAAKMGFTACILPKAGLSKIRAPKGIRLIGVGSIGEAKDLI